ncbi:MAG: polysaccharide biosynthesis protein GumN [Sphingomonas sp.]|nr:polysaccharide biosynthesis protein GumN [Sphingomonas sp.]
MRRLIAALLLFCCAMLLASCGRDAPVEAKPPLWRVSDGDTTVWLLASIHMLPPGTRWRDDAIAKAIGESQTLMLEIPPGNPSQASAVFLKVARASGLPPVAERLRPEMRALLPEAAANAGAEMRTLNGLKDWGAALVLAAGDARQSGARAEEGVEAALTQSFRQLHKPIGAFETLGGQFAIFDSLSPADQAHLLANAVADAAAPDNGYRAAFSAWAAGDTAALERAADSLFTGAPGLKSALLTKRNARWSRWIEQRMQRPGTALVAVGAGHLAGPDGLPALLAAQGYSVTRVQ